MTKSRFARWAAVGLLGLSLPVLAATTSPAKAKLARLHTSAVYPTAVKSTASMKSPAKTVAKPQSSIQHKKLTTSSKKTTTLAHKPLVKSKSSIKHPTKPAAKKPLATKTTAKKTFAKKTTVRKAPAHKLSTKPATRKPATPSSSARRK